MVKVGKWIKDYRAQAAFQYLLWYCKQHLKFGICRGCIFEKTGKCIAKFPEAENE